MFFPGGEKEKKISQVFDTMLELIVLSPPRRERADLALVPHVRTHVTRPSKRVAVTGGAVESKRSVGRQT